MQTVLVFLYVVLLLFAIAVMIPAIVVLYRELFGDTFKEWREKRNAEKTDVSDRSGEDE